MIPELYWQKQHSGISDTHNTVNIHSTEKHTEKIFSGRVKVIDCKDIECKSWFPKIIMCKTISLGNESHYTHYYTLFGGGTLIGNIHSSLFAISETCYRTSFNNIQLTPHAHVPMVTVYCYRSNKTNTE